MIRCAPKVWLSQEARDDLERFSRSRTLSARLVERARIVLRAAVGQENQQIADQLGLCRQTVGRWRERFAAAQINGLGLYERSESAKRKEADQRASKLASRRRGSHPRRLRLLRCCYCAEDRTLTGEGFSLRILAAPCETQ